MLKKSLSMLSFIGLMIPMTAGAADTFRLCTGSPGKTYHAVGQKLAELANTMSAGELKIELVNSKGSIDNLNKIAAGECDGAIAQGDAVAFYGKHVNQQAGSLFRLHTPLYKELSFLLCSRDSGIEESDDLLDTDGASVAAGAMGSGSLATWLTFREIDPDYANVRVIAQNGAEGALAVVRGEASCLFEVIGPQSDFIAALDSNPEIGKSLRFAEVDEDLADYEINGQKVYTVVEFDDEKYDNISAWGDPELLAITAYLVVSEQWAAEHGTGMGALSMTTLTGLKEIEAVAYGEQKPFEE